jgi:hypothetical protein
MALDATQRQRHQQVSKELFAAIHAARELPDGYAFSLPAETPVILLAAEFISRERLCCPFFEFQLEVKNGDTPLWLRITGRDGVKQFLKSLVPQ